MFQVVPVTVPFIHSLTCKPITEIKLAPYQDFFWGKVIAEWKLCRITGDGHATDELKQRHNLAAPCTLTKRFTITNYCWQIIVQAEMTGIKAIGNFQI
jgi:hypothetical protein